jgi:hypothetical protein
VDAFPSRWQSYFAITGHGVAEICETVVVDQQRHKEVAAVRTFAVLPGELVGTDNPFLTMWASNKNHKDDRSKVKSTLLLELATASNSRCILRRVLGPRHSVFAVHKTDARMIALAGQQQTESG